jgi:Flp pilus assembly pilin Flp
MGIRARRGDGSGPTARRGQGLLEYALIILLVVLVVVGAVTLIGPAIAQALSGVSPAL